jgi:hypothetical protein
VKVEFDPAAVNSYGSIPFQVAARVDEILDWIEADDPQRRHKSTRFADGQWAVSFRVFDDSWVLVWEVDGEVAAIRHIGEVTSLGR